MFKYEEKFSTVRRECETFHTDQLLENKTKENDFKDAVSHSEKLRNEINGMRELQRLFYNFCSLVNHL